MFVETKREGESVVREPSVAGFKAWLEMQPKEGTFEYFRCKKCAVGQYLTSLGLNPTDDPLIFFQLNQFPKAVSYSRDWAAHITFGDVLAEIERATTFKTA